MMIDAVTSLGVLTIMLMIVAQVRRLFAHAILNRTIRKALEVDPPSARLLINKIEPRPRWPDVLAGWIMVVAGVALATAGIFSTATERLEALQLGAIGVIVGGGILLYAWWIERATAGYRERHPDNG